MIYKNIFLSFFLLGLCLIGFSCKKFFTEKGKELTEQPLARVNEIFLYPSDIAGMGSGNTRQDSIKIVNGYILDWVQRNLIIDKAEKNLPKELLDIDKKVDNYRQSLIIYNYESELIAQKLNTSIAKEEKQKYYNQFTSSFICEDDIFNLQYIVLSPNTPNIDNWTRLFKSNIQEDQVQLRSLCKISSSRYEIEKNKWYTRGEILKTLEVPIELLDKLGKNGEVIKYNNGASLILIKKLELKAVGEIAPYDRVEADINQILLTKNKTIILDQIYQEIYNEGAEKKQFEILTNTKN